VQLILMCLGKFGHAGEAEIVARGLAGVHRGPETLILMAPVYPARSEAEAVCGLVIMKQAFRRVKYVFLADPLAA
jgi:hypothetical protein